MSAIPSWARVGAKVVCVSSDGWKDVENRLSPMPGPAYNEICVIADVTLEVDGVWLQIAGYPASDSFDADRFRPLVTLEHDMAVHFSALLDVPASHEVDA